jgi:TGF-beta propeptide
MHCRTLVFLLSAIVAASLALPPRADAASVTLASSVDIGLPFWCDWSYDWEARCYTDDSSRLPVGGVDDKVWRAALRFDLGSIPAGATITSASLRLFHDGWCVAPRLTAIQCPWQSYTVNAHRIWSADWFAEREPEVDRRAAAVATLPAGSVFRWLAWSLTTLTRGWHSGTIENNGIALKLADSQEDIGSGGPYFVSASGPDPAARPRLVVVYSPPSP